MNLLFTLALTNTSFSQDNSKVTHPSYAEKIYLQLDGGVYTLDQTLWFKAIVASAVDHSPSLLSEVLYVDLVAPDERIIQKKLVKLTHGLGHGFFELDTDYTEGKYQVRAYTEWNENYDEGLVFKSYIDIFSSSKDEKENLINNVTLSENQLGGFKLNAQLRPYLLDHLQKKRLIVYLSFDNKKDTLVLKKNNADNYLLDYAIPINANHVTLTMETENQLRYSKTVVLNENIIDLQFFPEGGHMVHGLPNKIGFKVLDYSGKGIKVAGEILDDKDEVVALFKSNALGMGFFYLKPSNNKTYVAKITSSRGKILKIPLPEVVPKGSLLSISKAGENIKIMATSNYRKTDSVLVKVSCRGVDYYLIEGRLKNRHLIAAIPDKGLPEGIITFTLMDDTKQPIAERLFFNERQENRLNIKLSTDKASYGQREKTELDIKVLDPEEQVVNANLSILVMNRDQMGGLQDTRKNILSHFLLGSELNGEIEDPGYYFDSKNKSRINDLDVLLLTQGWRKFNFNERPNGIRQFQPERNLSVSGLVSGILSQKKIKKGIDLKMMTFGKVPSFYAQKTDSLGRFNFQLNDEYGPLMKILLESSNKSGKKKSYTITLDDKKSPEITYDHVKNIERVDSVLYALVEKLKKRKAVEAVFKPTYGVTELKEVIVEGQRLTPQRKKVVMTYGEADVLISGEAIQKKEKDWSYGLYSVLLFNYPEEISIERFPDGFMLAHINGGGVTLVVIDGIPVMEFDYPLIPSIPPSEVKSVELIKYAKNFLELYMTVFSNFDISNLPKFGSVIAIYTNAGKGISRVHKPVGLLQASIPVFSPVREFYSPKYEKEIPADKNKPDLRSLIHWAPLAEIDSKGHSSASFYNADIPGEMLVVVEAISENGDLGYQELVYIVTNED